MVVGGAGGSPFTVVINSEINGARIAGLQREAALLWWLIYTSLSSRPVGTLFGTFVSRFPRFRGPVVVTHRGLLFQCQELEEFNSDTLHKQKKRRLSNETSEKSLRGGRSRAKRRALFKLVLACSTQFISPGGSSISTADAN